MSGVKSVEIVCSACGAEAFLVRRPVYDGLKKTGETLACSACGHAFPSEADVPFKHREPVRIFTDADRSKEVKVFAEKEAERLCRYCVRYLVNPFMQWCSLHQKEVEATDTCDRFERKKEPAGEKPAQDHGSGAPECR